LLAYARPSKVVLKFRREGEEREKDHLINVSVCILSSTLVVFGLGEVGEIELDQLAALVEAEGCAIEPNVSCPTLFI
jgi:hypothetical protein